MTSENIITKNYEWDQINDNLLVNPQNNGKNILQWIKPNDEKYKYLSQDVISKIFPALETSNKNILVEGLMRIINFIHLKTARHISDAYWRQLTQNNNIDMRAIVNMMLPYINDNEAEENKKHLRSLSELYLEMDATGKYVYTNSQYNRCVRKYNGDNIDVYFRSFSIDYFNHNLDLLMMSIEMASNKLYINWVDVLPVTMNQFVNSILYKDTVAKIIGDPNRPIKTVALIKNYIDPNPGLSFQDIYNVMSNHLYYQIRNYRWLIYDINSENRPVTYFSYLETRFTLDPIIAGKLWNQISRGQQAIFSTQWKNFFNSTNTTDNTILHHFYFYFAKYHRSAAALIREGKLELTMNISDEIEDSDDDIIVTPESTINAKRGLANTPVEEIYTFFYDQIMAFRSSWFYYVLKIKKQPYIAQGNNIYITPKNIYNYSKSMVHSTDNPQNKFNPLPKYWASLNPSQINIIMYRMLDIPNEKYNDWTKNNWFNINNYFRRVYRQIPDEKLAETNKNMHLLIHGKLVDIIFESLIYHGLLSQLIPAPEITDKTILLTKNDVSDEKKLNNYRRSKMREMYFTGKSGKDYENTYYYLTGETYAKLPVKYFDFLATNQIWTFTYAMNWVSQYNFYHHYAHNRVIYITGATGVGKSTQVPKLLLYSQKMLDYNNNGKIICTQPRIEPTVSNAKTISRELGVPVMNEDLPTGSYYVQYQYKDARHTNQSNSFLRIVTDGTLLEQIVQYPFLTRSIPDKSATDVNDAPAEWARVYRANNIYDTVIVDEAHEHNANMDLILTMARDATYVNNSIKLVIISATMDDDEPIYRRYYRNINDNRAYPLSNYIATNILDRANTDRRIHISEPGATTQHKITDHYLTKAQSDLINDKNFVKYGIQLALDVLSKTTDGDMLVFMTGRKEIKKTVEEINAKTPANIISFGYYSELTDEQKNFIRDIHINLPKYTRFKEDVDMEEKDVTRRVPAGTYTRAVIVATNVAEASITLTRLRYVVDTGYANVNIYDPISGREKLVKMPISWSSSQQRRGRVGRVAPGDVYYLYDREKIINNKTAYNITNIDIMNQMVKLLKANPNDSNIIIYLNDINNIRNLLKLLSAENDDLLVYKLLKNPHPYIDIIRRQYLYEQNTSDASQYYKYIGKTSLPLMDENLLLSNPNEYMLKNHDDYHFQMDSLNDFTSKNYTGYDDYRLADNNLTFYLIHPDENIIVRDKYTGRLIGLRDNNTVSSDYMHYLLKENNQQGETGKLTLDLRTFRFMKFPIAMENAESQMLVSDIPTADINVVLNYNDIPDNTVVYVDDFFDEIQRDIEKESVIRVKSQFLANLQEIRNITKLDVFNDIKNLLWYSYAIPYGLEKDVLALILLINNETDISIMIDENKRSRPYVEKFFLRHLTNQGDIYVIWNLWLELKNILIENNLYNYEIDQRQEQIFIDLKNKYINNKVLTPKEHAIFNKMYYSGQLNSDDEFYYYVSQMPPPVIELNPKIINQINNIAKRHLMEPKLFTTFVVKYNDLLFEIARTNWLHIYKIDHGLADEDEKLTDIVEWAKIHLALPSVFTHTGIDAQWDRILESYIRAYSTNSVEVFPEYYVSLNNGSVFYPQDWSKYLAIEKTFQKNKTKYIVYHHKLMGSDGIAYETPVQLEWIFKLNPIYYYFLLFNTNNILHEMKDEPQAAAILKSLDDYKSKFDFGNLYQYLDLIGDKNTATRIRRQINTANNKKIDNIIIY